MAVWRGSGGAACVEPFAVGAFGEDIFAEKNLVVRLWCWGRCRALLL
jgi:hypothetical protein